MLVDARPLQGPSAARGIGRYVRSLLAAMVEQGYGPRLAALLDASAPVPELPSGGLVAFAIRRRYHGRLAPWEDALALPRDLAMIRPALYHATTLSLPGRCPIPMVATVHDLAPWAWGGRAMLGERVRYAPGRRLLGRAEAVIAPSRATAADVTRLAGVPAERVRVIPEAVSSRFFPREGARERLVEAWGLSGPYVIFVGSLEPRKDPLSLHRAVRLARRVRPDLELVVAGAQTRPAAAPDTARTLGYVDDDQLADLLTEAEALVYPSRFEGFGLPPLEAMACGCPVVAYSNTSLPEVVGDAGLLVPDGDARALGAALAGLLEDPALGARLRQAGLRQARRFSWEKAARATIATYKEVAV